MSRYYCCDYDGCSSVFECKSILTWPCECDETHFHFFIWTVFKLTWNYSIVVHVLSIIIKMDSHEITLNELTSHCINGLMKWDTPKICGQWINIPFGICCFELDFSQEYENLQHKPNLNLCPSHSFCSRGSYLHYSVKTDKPCFIFLFFILTHSVTPCLALSFELWILSCFFSNNIVLVFLLPWKWPLKQKTVNKQVLTNHDICCFWVSWVIVGKKESTHNGKAIVVVENWFLKW